MKSYHNVKGLDFEGDVMRLTIDGKQKEYRLHDISPRLQNASEQERLTYEISPSGYGIHWPLLDEDLSIDGLLGIIHTPRQKVKKS